MDRSTAPDDAEDSAFYAELTRRILLLTDEDDEEPQVKNKYVRRFNHRLIGGGGLPLIPGNYFSWSEGGEVSVPGWMERLWAANGGGTGVFIPCGGVGRPRRRHKKPKKNNERGRVHPAAGHKNLGSS
ncbi:hypothetical protein L1987_73005 [Smallanthus sonchifolius]|uniref:Uncharacterized protein n=1 Tax=Smallanthus sonchifolius TaxID=185202 RepID=A0ACB9AVW5_9ASTR|nr:hypothetical protein L1987_73005 [Smallanthus sonchifolius]